MIYATLYNRNGDPVGNDEQIENDTQFEILERKARKVGGVCIAWYRDTDGQSAYWGPGGARFDRYYY